MKLKVKDLATELGIGHKEILQHLRDMDIQVKSLMSTLEDDEADQLRRSLRGAPAPQTEVVRREVQPGVIVRSRKNKPGEAEPAPREAAKPAPVAEAPAEPVAESKPEAKAEEAPAPVKPRAKAEAKPEPAAPATARIVAPEELAKPEPAEPVKVAEPAPVAEAPAEPVKPAKAPKAAAHATARIVSPEELAKPEPAEAAKPEPAAEPATPKVEETAKVVTRVVTKVVEPAPKAEATEPVAKVVAPAAQAGQEPEAKAEAAPAPQAEQSDKPAAPAAPAPQSGDQPREAATGGDQQRRPKREVVVPAAPQVRIISRPDPNQVAAQAARRPEFSAQSTGGGARPYTPHPGAPRPQSDGPRGGGYGGQRPEGGRGPGGDRPGGDRPGGYQPRPGGDRPGGYQPRPGGGPGGYQPRPAGPGAAPAIPLTEEEQRRRTKDRRVVDFPGSGGSSEEDRRKAAAGGPAKKRSHAAPMPPVLSEDGDAPMRLKSSRRKKSRHGGQEQREELKPVGKRKIRIDESIRLSDLAHQMGIKAQAIIKTLFGMGMMATINQALDLDTATLLANEYGHEVESVGFDEQEFLSAAPADAPEDLKPRPPVVTIMGHVDHGKTSLLDAIRKTSIASGEAGGITQHIGAYHVATNRGEVVFLDTPGHEAFTAMRARGAQVTDIVVLVVAADDGVMDQTREAVNHSKAAGVPIVVAVNKIDKEGANPDRVKRELAEFDLVPEEWGGTTIFANVSAKQRIGLDELLEMILLQAEVLELKANPSKPAKGHIVEAKLDKGRGPLGTVLIQEGTLTAGDAFVCGTVHGKVRAMFNDQGKKIKQAGPAIPVEIQGFDVVPEAGDEFVVVADDKVARKIAESRMAKQREKDLVGKSTLTLESFLKSKPAQEAKALNLVLKADVQGSLEAITEALHKLSTDEVKIQVVHAGTGGLTESDVMLATASQAIIIGFNVRPTSKVKEVAEREQVEIRFYDIIYKLVGEIKDAMSGMLAPDIQEVYLGQAEVRETFSVPKVGTVAGCGVVDGKLVRNAKIRLLRDGVVIYTGALSSLKRFKDDAKEVAKGYECGAGLENFNDIKVGDIIEAFETKEVARTL